MTEEKRRPTPGRPYLVDVGPFRYVNDADGRLADAATLLMFNLDRVFELLPTDLRESLRADVARSGPATGRCPAPRAFWQCTCPRAVTCSACPTHPVAADCCRT